MAKEKKRGFFSWLGFGRDQEDQQSNKQVTEQQQSDQPAAENQHRDDSVVENQQSAEPVAEPQAHKPAAEDQHRDDSVVENQHSAEPVAEPQAHKPAVENQHRDDSVVENRHSAEPVAEPQAHKPAAEDQHRDDSVVENQHSAEPVAEPQAHKPAAEDQHREEQVVETPHGDNSLVEPPQVSQGIASDLPDSEPRETDADESTIASPVAQPDSDRQNSGKSASQLGHVETSSTAINEQPLQAAQTANDAPQALNSSEAPSEPASDELAEPQATYAFETNQLDVGAGRMEQQETAESETQAARPPVVTDPRSDAPSATSTTEIEAPEVSSTAENGNPLLTTLESEYAAQSKNTLEPEPTELEEAVAAPAQKPPREGFFSRLKRSLVKTRQNLGTGFIGLFRGKKIDDDLFEELEEQLLIADVGVETTRRIINNLTTHANRQQLKDAEALYGLLKQEMAEILGKVDQPLDIEQKTPFVILMVGVNGVGKTTTIGKLARQYQSQGKSVMLAAGDTFRAAAVEQLQVWGERNHIPVIAQHTGADSASVIYDSIQAAKSRGIDVLIADTAGRLQNKSHLMEELKKITRVMHKLDESAPHEVMLTLDASTGQNAISQAKLFNEAVGLTGITLTKLDGTAKGGVIFSIADQFGIPIRYIGVGEGIEDLRPFKADDFIEALFARED